MPDEPHVLSHFARVSVQDSVQPQEAATRLAARGDNRETARAEGSSPGGEVGIGWRM